MVVHPCCRAVQKFNMTSCVIFCHISCLFVLRSSSVRPPFVLCSSSVRCSSSFVVRLFVCRALSFVVRTVRCLFVVRSLFFCCCLFVRRCSLVHLFVRRSFVRSFVHCSFVCTSLVHLFVIVRLLFVSCCLLFVVVCRSFVVVVCCRCCLFPYRRSS